MASNLDELQSKRLARHAHDLLRANSAGTMLEAWETCEVERSKDGRTLWLNVDGVCVARVKLESTAVLTGV